MLDEKPVAYMRFIGTWSKLTPKWEGLPGPERSATGSKPPKGAAPQAGRPTHKARQRHTRLNTTTALQSVWQYV